MVRQTNELQDDKHDKTDERPPKDSTEPEMKLCDVMQRCDSKTERAMKIIKNRTDAEKRSKQKVKEGE